MFAVVKTVENECVVISTVPEKYIQFSNSRVFSAIGELEKTSSMDPGSE